MSAGVAVESRQMNHAFSGEGERDYNHSVDKEYVTLRKLSDQAFSKRKSLSQQSQNAYKQGNKQKAHELSLEAQKYLTQANYYSFKAAEYVFYENNLDSSPTEVDLHGLFIKEAEFIVKQRIVNIVQNKSIANNVLEIIVGKGLHSKNGIAKLKPAIESVCDEAHLNNYLDPKNSGVLIVDLSNISSINQLPSSWLDDINTMNANINESMNGVNSAPVSQPQMAYHPQQQQPQQQQQNYYGQPQQQQQQNYYNQQQQGNNNNNNDMVLGILKLICNCLK